jgi:uncharacterized OB-fold protein
MTSEEAINIMKVIVHMLEEKYDTDRVEDAVDMAIKALEQEPKTGHWIDHQEDRWIYAQCSECGTVHDTQTNYCPNCGAKMLPTDSEKER